MEYKTLGGTKEKISAVGLGSWKLGAEGEKKAIAALRAGFDAGIDFVDTAEMYGTEPLVGRAIRGRKGIFVASKVLPSHLRYDDVIRACDASLGRLGVRTIDLYQVHWPNRKIPIRETMRAMEKLVRDGKIRYIGVSNFSAEEVTEAREALKANDLVSDQVEYSLMVREVERELLGYCSRRGLTVVAYSPLAHGAIYDARHADLLRLLSEVGKAYGKTPTQVAMNWLVRQRGVVAIPKASTPEHARELAGSAGWRLSARDAGAIGDLAVRGHLQPPIKWGPLLRRFPGLMSLAAWSERRDLKRRGVR
jgi:diketogulonate reductase-like aldo/keto reductase